jgi:formyltetrahydrofolate-dependent phosphoribosylglycinamide formyltransferase
LFTFAPRSPLRLVVLISGGGTTLRNLIEKIAAGKLDARIELVVSSNPAAAGLESARAAGIPSEVVERREFDSIEAFSEALFAACRRAAPDIVVMGGFLKLVVVPADFENRVVNIHPALIPAFCGKGFYGRRVHEAVLEHGTRVSGCTVHFVDNRYDHGPVLLQRVVPVLDDDTLETLAARVFAAECEAYPEALRLIADGRVQIDGRRVTIKRSGSRS